MVKDLQQEFLQGRINKARDEIAKVLENYNLLFSAELNYTQQGIFPVIKLVENKKENSQEQKENK